MYYSAVRTVLTQLYRIPQGDTIEEDHQRNRQLIVNYVMDKTGAIRKVERNGKTYLLLEDFDKLIMPGVTHWNHPNFHGLVAVCPLYTLIGFSTCSRYG